MSALCPYSGRREVASGVPASYGSFPAQGRWRGRSSDGPHPHAPQPSRRAKSDSRSPRKRVGAGQARPRRHRQATREGYQAGREARRQERHAKPPATRRRHLRRQGSDECIQDGGEGRAESPQSRITSRRADALSDHRRQEDGWKLAVIREIDVWRAAKLPIGRHGDEAPLRLPLSMD